MPDHAEREDEFALCRRFLRRLFRATICPRSSARSSACRVDRRSQLRSGLRCDPPHDRFAIAAKASPMPMPSRPRRCNLPSPGCALCQHRECRGPNAQTDDQWEARAEAPLERPGERSITIIAAVREPEEVPRPVTDAAESEPRSLTGVSTNWGRT